jgi:hypothetical protein
MALQPLPALGLPHKTPPFHIWHYSHFRPLASPTRRLHSIYDTTAPSSPWPPPQDPSIPYITLQPLPALGLPHKTPPFHIWHYNPFRPLASLTRRLHSSIFSSLLLDPLTPSSCNASLWTTSLRLVLGLPTGLVVYKFPFQTICGRCFLIVDTNVQGDSLLIDLFRVVITVKRAVEGS